MIDCGGGFADDYLHGVDMIVADISFIEKPKNDLVGLVLTHAHEDHLGAVQYLWNNLQCPIYATTFTTNFLKLRLAKYDFAKDIKIHTVKPATKISLHPFQLEMVPLTHSAPEMQAIMIRTETGNIFIQGIGNLIMTMYLVEKQTELLKSSISIHTYLRNMYSSVYSACSIFIVAHRYSSAYSSSISIHTSFSLFLERDTLALNPN
ncbi:hypothetical protein KSP40_PGU021833 [Platanthera guangdongensis]|uniref:Metallo-beta-lactamase domain-containing protein n=1 Tax=Platanthera guangdongensis TaxID=2320717 RepID=A0ABR2M9H5_9ASPA